MGMAKFSVFPTFLIQEVWLSDWHGIVNTIETLKHNFYSVTDKKLDMTQKNPWFFVQTKLFSLI